MKFVMLETTILWWMENMVVFLVGSNVDLQEGTKEFVSTIIFWGEVEAVKYETKRFLIGNTT